MREVSGEFVAFIDADDLWPAGKLASALAHLAARPDSQVVIGHGQLMRRRPGSDAFEYASAPGEIFANYIGAALYRRSVFARVGLFDERLRFGEDQDWFLRAADADIGLYRVEEISLLVRRHERNMTRGASRTDLNPLLLFKKALDRQREAAAQGSVPAPRLAADD